MRRSVGTRHLVSDTPFWKWAEACQCPFRRFFTATDHDLVNRYAVHDAVPVGAASREPGSVKTRAARRSRGRRMRSDHPPGV